MHPLCGALVKLCHSTIIIKQLKQHLNFILGVDKTKRQVPVFRTRMLNKNTVKHKFPACDICFLGVFVSFLSHKPFSTNLNELERKSINSHRVAKAINPHDRPGGDSFPFATRWNSRWHKHLAYLCCNIIRVSIFLSSSPFTILVNVGTVTR